MQDDKISDLIEAIAARGDRDAFAVLFRHFAPRLKAYVMRCGADAATAEEVAQETMVLVWRRAAIFDRTRAGGSTWIFAIARNKFIDAIRKRGKRIFVNIDDFAETLPGETEEVLPTAGEVQDRLRSLPARQREVLQSIAVESTSIKDTAAKFSMSEVAVRVALHRGLTSLTAKVRES